MAQSKVVSDGVLYLTSIILPPLAVYMKKGAQKDLGVNAGLTILGYVPGILHALYLVSSQ